MSCTLSSLFSSQLPFPFDKSRPFWEALEALDTFFESLKGYCDPSAQVSPMAALIDPEKIFIGPGAKIEAGAQIVGPAYIGPNATIAHGALVRGKSLVLESAVVGHCSEIKRSILFPKAKAAHFNYVGDSLVGSEVNLGAGAILCNLRLDKKSVRVEGHETKAPKLGAAIGDKAAIGAGVICNPGAIIEQGAFVQPKTIVSGRFSQEAQLR